MREIGVRRKDFEMFSNPKKDGLLHPMFHPEVTLSTKSEYRLYPENFLINDFSIDSIPIYCYLVFTNKVHDGLWLIQLQDNSVELLGGALKETELEMIKNHEPVTAIYKSIIRDSLNQNGMDESIIPNIAYIESLKYMANMIGINELLSQPRLYYSYKPTDHNGKCVLRIFMVAECEKPEVSTIPLLDYRHRNLLWYSRESHFINKTTKTDRKNLFNSFGNDIRTTKEGVNLLDTILSYENLFGKSDIY